MADIKRFSAMTHGTAGATGLPNDEVLVIMHIDDIGMLADTADSAIEVMRHGMAKSGSIMVPAPGFERAAQVIKDNPDLDCGIHITLTNEWQERIPWRPLLSKDEVPSLYNEQGLMWRNEGFFAYHAEAGDVEKEMEKQIQTALKTGIKFSHMDAHMGCYFMRHDLFNIALKLAQKYQLTIVAPYPYYFWFRRSDLEDLKNKGIKCPDSFYGFYRDSPHALKTYRDYLAGLTPGVHYIFIHPVRSTPETKRLLPDLAIRARDYAIWTGEKIRKFAAAKHIKFISFPEF